MTAASSPDDRTRQRVTSVKSTRRSPLHSHQTGERGRADSGPAPLLTPQVIRGSVSWIHQTTPAVERSRAGFCRAALQSGRGFMHRSFSFRLIASRLSLLVAGSRGLVRNSRKSRFERARFPQNASGPAAQSRVRSRHSGRLDGPGRRIQGSADRRRFGQPASGRHAEQTPGPVLGRDIREERRRAPGNLDVGPIPGLQAVCELSGRGGLACRDARRT